MRVTSKQRAYLRRQTRHLTGDDKTLADAVCDDLDDMAAAEAGDPRLQTVRGKCPECGATGVYQFNLADTEPGKIEVQCPKCDETYAIGFKGELMGSRRSATNSDGSHCMDHILGVCPDACRWCGEDHEGGPENCKTKETTDVL